MLFNSIQFLFLFLPFVLFAYFFLNKHKFTTAAKIFLVFASLFFYGFWNIKYVSLILFSALFNFAAGSMLNVKSGKQNKYVLFFGIFINVLVLGYYKYADFFIKNINTLFKTHIELLHIILPLAISFFTFQQISYLVDSYNRKTRECDFLNYILFVTFFPQLIAGPIVRHTEMMPQFKSVKTKVFNPKNFCEGLFLFIIGLFKKVVIADTLAKWADIGYANTLNLTFLEAWISIFSYTFQIYYDFSGYSDMAIGIGKMFNINLPQNFNNPYQAVSIQDFWHRWHISLSRFLKDYIYIPLSNLCLNRYMCVLIVFFISGLWHGASWLFVIWGLLHGIAVIVNRILKKYNININQKLSFLVTFIYLNLTWVFFRSENITIAKNMFLAAFYKNGFAVPKISHLNIEFEAANSTNQGDLISLILIPVLIFFIFFPVLKKLYENFKPDYKYCFISALLFIFCILVITNPDSMSPFIYFNF